MGMVVKNSTFMEIEKMVIHKQILKVVDTQKFDIKGLIEILSVGVQNGQLCMWFMRDRGYERSHSVTVKILGTGNEHGHNETSGMDFMGTHLMSGGQLVWHVWAVKI